jgi:hypothetical protein
MTPTPEPLPVLDGYEAPRLDRLVVARCVVHAMAENCQAARASCCREFVPIPPAPVGFFRDAT